MLEKKKNENFKFISLLIGGSNSANTSTISFYFIWESTC